jgi:putative hydrolase of the HAD superfamily
MQLNNATASECLMIGDSYEADIVGARNAGIDQVFYNPYRDEKKREATYNANSLLDIFQIL